MYVALDRPEFLYATKIVASFVQTPTKSAMVKLKRLVRYLVGYSQAEWIYSKQTVPKYLDVYGDSDWAGDEERKRSTAGLAEVFGSHQLDAVSVTQSLVALSSAEAEFYACNCGTSGGLQTCHLLSDTGYRVIPRVWCDSSACRGIVRRAGTGKLRHLEIRHMWAQERLQKGEFLLKAIPTENNVADLMTKHLAAVRIEELLTKLGVRRCAWGLVVASLITKVEANYFDGPLVASSPLIGELSREMSLAPFKAPLCWVKRARLTCRTFFPLPLSKREFVTNGSLMTDSALSGPCSSIAGFDRWTPLWPLLGPLAAALPWGTPRVQLDFYVRLSECMSSVAGTPLMFTTLLLFSARTLARLHWAQPLAPASKSTLGPGNRCVRATSCVRLSTQWITHPPSWF